MKMKNNLPVINPELLHMQAPDATLRCPTHAIVWVDGSQDIDMAEEMFRNGDGNVV